MVVGLGRDSTITSGLATCGHVLGGMGRSSRIQCGRRAEPWGSARRVVRRVVPRNVRRPSGAVNSGIPRTAEARRLSCRRAPALDDSRAQPRSQGDPRRPAPLRRDRADPDHLRRDRPADRLLPPRRLAPVHRRAPRHAGQAQHRRHPDRRASSPPSSATRSATIRQEGRPGLFRARTRGSSSRSTSNAPKNFFDRHGAEDDRARPLRARRAHVRAGRSPASAR